MGDFTGSAIKLIIAFALGIAVVNDIGAIATANYWAERDAIRVAEGGALAYTNFHTDDKALDGARATAAQVGVELTGFEVTPSAVRVAIRVTPQRTVFVQRIEALKSKIGFEAQASAPFTH